MIGSEFNNTSWPGKRTTAAAFFLQAFQGTPKIPRLMLPHNVSSIPPSKDIIELRHTINTLKSTLLEYTSFFEKIVEISEGVFDFSESRRFQGVVDSARDVIKTADQKKLAFDANPANSFNPEFQQLGIWIALLKSLIDAKESQVLRTTLELVNLLQIPNQPNLPSTVTLRIDRWVKGNKGTYKIPDPFLTFYYAQIIESKNVENMRSKVLEQILKQRYANNEFTMTFIAEYRDSDFNIVYHKCNIAHVPFKTPLGEKTEDLPLQGSFRPDSPSTHFKVLLQETIRQQATTCIEELREMLGFFYTATGLNNACHHHSLINEKLAVLHSCLDPQKPEEVLKDEIQYFYHLALVDPKSAISINDDVDIDLECHFHPLVLCVKALMFNEEVKGFKKYFISKFEEWVFSHYTLTALEQYGIHKKEDLRSLGISFSFKYQKEEYIFVLTLDDYLEGCEQEGGDANMISFCIKNTLESKNESITPIVAQTNRGILNIGNSCYINSTLQALFSLTYITNTYNAAFQRELNSKRKALAEELKNAPDDVKKKIQLRLDWLDKLIDLHTSTMGLYGKLNDRTNMRDTMVSYRAKLFGMVSALHGQNILRQQDALDVAACIMEASGFYLNMETKTTGTHTETQKFYSSKHAPEPLQILSLALKQDNDNPDKINDPVDLGSRLNYYMNNPIFSDDPPWRPDPDNHPEIEITHFTETRRFNENLPEILGLHFKRFDNNLVRCEREIIFPEDDILDVTPYLKSAQAGSKVLYKLKSLVIHAGGKTLEGGHYYAYVKRSGKWYRMSDGDVCEVHSRDVQRNMAYMAFFERHEQPPALDID